VERGIHEHVQGRRRGEAAEDDDGHRILEVATRYQTAPRIAHARAAQREGRLNPEASRKFLRG
jgi:hypothetical protein